MKEVFTDIPNTQGYYRISNLGRVYSTRKDLYLKPSLNGYGYEHVGLCVKGSQITTLIHRLVAEAYIPNPHNKPQVNHKDGDKANNYYTNLEWVTVAENTQHAYDSGLILSSRALSDEQVRELRDLYFNKLVGCNKLSKKYNLSVLTVRRIINRNIYVDVV